MLVQEHLETGPYVLDVPLVALCVGFRTEPLNGVFVLIYGFHNRFSLLNPVHDRNRAEAVTRTQLSSIDGLIIPSEKRHANLASSQGRRPDFTLTRLGRGKRRVVEATRRLSSFLSSCVTGVASAQI
jgi:hypothetical protein